MNISGERVRKIIESDVTEWVMLCLAGLAVGMHLTYLLAVFAEEPQARIFFIVSLIVDLVFVVDFFIKIIVLRKEYLRSPWFVVDFLAAIPVISTVVEGVHILNSLRTMRWLRAFRFFRVLKALRAIKAMRMLKFLVKLPDSLQNQLMFDKVIKYGVIAFSVIFVIFLTSTERTKEKSFIADMKEYCSIMGDAVVIMEHPLHIHDYMIEPFTDYVSVQVNINNNDNTFYFISDHISTEMKMIEFYLLTGIIMGVLFALLLTYFQQKDSNLQLVYQLLNVFLPETVIKAFMEDEEAFYKQVHDKATVVFVDISGFTRSVEQYKDKPHYINENLTAVLNVIVEAMERHDLIVDKIIGDAVLSFRGGPLIDDDNEENALRVALASMEAIAGVEKLNNPVYRKIKVGIATGHCLIGAGGAETRLSYTVLGDTVNLAARLEPASGKIGTSNLIDEDTYELIMDRLDKEYSFRCAGSMTVSGKSEVVNVYEILPLQEDEEWIDLFEEGLQHRINREWDKAIFSFQAAHRARPGGDPLSITFIKNCSKNYNKTLPDNWDGSIEYVKG